MSLQWKKKKIQFETQKEIVAHFGMQDEESRENASFQQQSGLPPHIGWRMEDEINEIRGNLIKCNTSGECQGIAWYVCKIFVPCLQVKACECLVLSWQSDIALMCCPYFGALVYFANFILLWRQNLSPKITHFILQATQLPPLSTQCTEGVPGSSYQHSNTSPCQASPMAANPSVTSPHMAHCPQF